MTTQRQEKYDGLGCLGIDYDRLVGQEISQTDRDAHKHLHHQKHFQPPRTAGYTAVPCQSLEGNVQR